MTDLLIRNVPDDVVAALEMKAQRLGLSRSEFLRRQMVREATTSSETVTVASLERMGETFAVLADPDVMDQAWR